MSHIMNPNKTLAKKKTSKNVPQSLRTNLNTLLLHPGEVEKMPCPKESLEELFNGSEEQSEIARDVFRKKYNLHLDIEQPTANYQCKWEQLRKPDDK